MADRGPADRGPADRGPADRGPADRGPADRGPADRGPADRADRADPSSAVQSHNEWDLLEEVVVGVADHAVVPELHPVVEATMPEEHHDFFRRRGGRPFPPEIVDGARRDLEGFIELLEGEGVEVRTPERVDHSRPFSTPRWESASGLYAAMPRDLLLVVGDLMIEAPMAWRCRYFEVEAYRPLLMEYFRAGARWIAAPRPMLPDELYQVPGGRPAEGFALTEVEPTFDAADFLRLGRDLVGQLSCVTNRFGVEWLRSCLGSEYRVHLIDVDDPHPMHVDATLLPLAPGKLLANPERLPEAPPLFRDWEVRYAPPPDRTRESRLLMSSAWLSMNLLSLDERRVVVEQGDRELAELLEDWGFETLPCRFDSFNALGGSFHCATLDVRRRGRLESYF